MRTTPAVKPLQARRSPGLNGKARVPGDKSISHRALILGALAVGETRISGLLEAEDVLRTVAALGHLGVEVQRDGEGVYRLFGRGVGGWCEPAGVLDFGNSGTGSRLLMGAVATTPITAVFCGDTSLMRRPMARVLEPLTKFGSTYTTRHGGFMPVTLTGACQPIAIDHEVAVASAQVKSAILLAALNAPGRSRVVQRTLTRDHTERMLRGFGAEIEIETLDGGGEAIHIKGEEELHASSVEVPGDPSSAAFAIVAATIIPGSNIVVPGVLLNPRRTGFIETLREMGARISVANERTSGGEIIGDIEAGFSQLKGIEIPANRAPSMIDEYPVLAIAAAFAEGRTAMHGLEELMVKESDRLSVTAAALQACGVQVQTAGASLAIEGRGADGVAGGTRVSTQLDHRIAMAFLVLGLASRAAVSVDDTTMISTSFPEFERTLSELGAQFAIPNA